MPTPEVMREIRRATRVHGVAAAADFRLTNAQLSRACLAGVLERPHRGVYLDPAVPRSALRDLASAVHAGGPLAAAWGRSAAWLWGLVSEPPATPEIAIPRLRCVPIAGVVVHRSMDLHRGHISRRHGIPVVKPLVTILDLGVVLGPLDVAFAIIRAHRRKLFEPDAVRATIARLARPGRTGLTTARQGVELAMINGRPADSELELRFNLLAEAYELPAYEYQWEIVIDGRRLRIDFAYPQFRIAIEIDGYEDRESLESLSSDRRRQNLIVLDGWTVLRFSFLEIMFEQGDVARQVLAAIADAAASRKG